MNMSKIKYILIFTLSVLITTVLLGSAPITDLKKQTCEQQIDTLYNKFYESLGPLEFKHTILEGDLKLKIFANGLSDINMHYQAFLYELSLKNIDNSNKLKKFLESKMNTIAMISTFANFIDYLSKDEQLKIDHAKVGNDLVLEKFFAQEREKCQKQITDPIGQNKCRDDYLTQTVPAITFFYDKYKDSSTDPQKRKVDLELYKKVLLQNLPSFDKLSSPMHLSLEFMKKLDQETVSKKNQYHFTRYKNNLALNLDTHKSSFVESRYGDLNLISKHYPSNQLPNTKLPDPVRLNYVFAQKKQNAINTPEKDLDIKPFLETTNYEFYSHVLKELECFKQELTPAENEYRPSIFKMTAPKKCLEEYAKMNQEYAPTSSELLEKIYKIHQDFLQSAKALDCNKKPVVNSPTTEKDCLEVVDQPLINFAEHNISITQYLNSRWAIPSEFSEPRVTPIELDKEYQNFKDYFEARWGEYINLSKKPRTTSAEQEKEYQNFKDYFEARWGEYIKLSKKPGTISAEQEKEYQNFKDYFEARWGEYIELSKKPSATSAEQKKEYQNFQDYFEARWGEYTKLSQEQSINPAKQEKPYQNFQDYFEARWGEHTALSKEQSANSTKQEKPYQNFQEYFEARWGEHTTLSKEQSVNPTKQEKPYQNFQEYLGERWSKHIELSQEQSTPPAEEIAPSNKTQSLPTITGTGNSPSKTPPTDPIPEAEKKELLNLYEPPPDYQKTPIRNLVDRQGKHIASGSVSQLSNKYHITIDPATGKLLFKPRRGMWDLLNGALPNTQLYQTPQRYTSIWVGELSGLNKGTINRQVMYSQLAIQQDHWARQIYNIQSMLNWQPYSSYSYNSYTGIDLSYKNSDYSDYTKQYIRDRGLPYLNEY